MENLVIDTYSRRLQDMARSAARVSKGFVFAFCGGFAVRARLRFNIASIVSSR